MTISSLLDAILVEVDCEEMGDFADSIFIHHVKRGESLAEIKAYFAFSAAEARKDWTKFADSTREEDYHHFTRCIKWTDKLMNLYPDK